MSNNGKLKLKSELRIIDPRSLKMAPFDRSHTSFITMSLSSTVTEIFSVGYSRDLAIWVRGR